MGIVETAIQRRSVCGREDDLAEQQTIYGDWRAAGVVRLSECEGATVDGGAARRD